MRVQEKAVSVEFSTVVVSGIHWGLRMWITGDYCIELLTIVTVLDITSPELILFLLPSPILPTLSPTSGNHQSVLCIYEFSFIL